MSPNDCNLFDKQSWCTTPLELVFQEQSYSSLHSGRSLAWDHFRGVSDDPCGIADFCRVIANPCIIIADPCGVITDPCGVVAIPVVIGGHVVGDVAMQICCATH